MNSRITWPIQGYKWPIYLAGMASVIIPISVGIGSIIYSNWDDLDYNIKEYFYQFSYSVYFWTCIILGSILGLALAEFLVRAIIHIA